MSIATVFVTACLCAAALAVTCTVIVWAVKNILEWVADDIPDSLDTIKYLHNKHKRAKEGTR